MRRIHEQLLVIGDDREQRAGIAPSPARSPQVEPQRRGRTDDQLRRQPATEAHHSALARHEAIAVDRHNGGEATLAPALDPRVFVIDGASGGSRREGGRSVLGAIRRWCRRAGGRRPRTGRSGTLLLRHPDVGQRIEQAGVDGQPLAVDHPGLGRHGHVRPHRRDQAVGDDHGAVLDHRAGDGDDAGVGDGVVGWRVRRLARHLARRSRR